MSTTGAPSRATSPASSRAPPTVMPCASAAWPAFWITGPSASGSECGTPISSAATPEAASRFATSTDFLRFGCPAIRYGMSLRSPSARTASSSRDTSVALNRIHVLVAAPGKADEDPPARTETLREHARVVQRVRGLERGHDALEPRAELERGHRVLISHRDVL